MCKVAAETNRGVTVYLSDHACDRLKERNNWNEKTSARMITRIYEEGQRACEVKGYLKGWIMDKAEKNGNIEHILYGDNLYVFDAETHVLITLYPVPTREARQRIWDGSKKVEFDTKSKLEHEAAKRDRRLRHRRKYD